MHSPKPRWVVFRAVLAAGVIVAAAVVAVGEASLYLRRRSADAHTLLFLNRGLAAYRQFATADQLRVLDGPNTPEKNARVVAALQYGVTVDGERRAAFTPYMDLATGSLRADGSATGFRFTRYRHSRLLP